MVARFSAQKDHTTLLRALAGLQDQPWELDLVGEGPRVAETESLAASLGIRERVHFLGQHMDVDQILARAQVGLLVTNWEGFPLSILEAMRAGLPVVASAVGGVGESVRDQETGIPRAGRRGGTAPRADPAAPWRSRAPGAARRPWPHRVRGAFRPRPDRVEDPGGLSRRTPAGARQSPGASVRSDADGRPVDEERSRWVASIGRQRQRGRVPLRDPARTRSTDFARALRARRQGWRHPFLGVAALRSQPYGLLHDFFAFDPRMYARSLNAC